MPQDFLKQAKGFLFDLDGVFFVEDKIIDGADSALAFLKEKEYPCRFLSNTTTRSHASLHAKLSRIGISIAKEHLLTPPIIAARFLRERGSPRCLLILEEDTKSEFIEFPIDEKNPEVIVIGHYGSRWNYDLMNRLFHLVLNGAEILALHKGRYWETEDGLTLDIGAFVAGLEHATEKKAIVIGKPSESFFRLALEDMELNSSESVMIGDDLINDIGGAQNAGMKGVLVKTGKFREGILRRSSVKPDKIIESIAELPKLLEQ